MNAIRNFIMPLSLAVSVGAFSANAADGGLFVEPMVTYELGDTDVNYPAPLSNSSGEVNGFGIGARFGGHVSEAIFITADARYSMPTFKDSSIGYDASATAMNIGPSVGVQTPVVGLRVFGTYVLWSELDPESDGGVDVKMKEGQGFRIGAGFRVAMVSLNLEYQQIKYDKTELEQIGPFNPGTTFDGVELENKSWVASVSFPLEL